MNGAPGWPALATAMQPPEPLSPVEVNIVRPSSAALARITSSVCSPPEACSWGSQPPKEELPIAGPASSLTQAA